MLKLHLLPVGSKKARPIVSWRAPVLLVEEESYDLSGLPDNATAQHPVLGAVARNGDDYECSLKLTHSSNAPEETRFPEPITVTEDGPIELPPYDAPETEEADDDLAE